MKIWWRPWIFHYLTFALGVWFFPHSAPAQPKQEMISVSSPDIIAGAKKEGKLFLHPALRPEYDEATLPELLKAFNKRYPFIEATWGKSAMGARPNAKQALDELAAGKAVVDILGFSGSFPSEYPQRNLVKKYDLKTMVRDNQIKIPFEMIDHTAMIVWSSNNTGIITYNSTLVSEDNAPKGWDSCLDARWKGKFSVDTNPNTLTWLIPRWGEAKVLDFASKLKENNPVFARGNT